jgi:TonB family protein
MSRMPETETPNQPEPAREQPTVSLPTGGPLFGRQTPVEAYALHDLLEKINDLEDERRWARIREGVWISILLHVLIFSVITWMPHYLLHMPRVVDPLTVLKNRKDLTYLDLPPDALKNIKPKKEAPQSDKNRQAQSPKPILDKKTLAELQAMAKANAPAPPPVQQQQQPPQQMAQNTPPKPEFQPIPPNPQSQSPFNAPRAVPAKPNFSTNNLSPGNAIRQAARDAASQHNGGYFGAGNASDHNGLKNGVDIISDTQGVDFGPYIQKMLHETRKTWEPLIPESVRPPLYKKGTVLIQFTINPDGSVKDRSMIRMAPSGDPSLDRAAWGAIQGSDYPPLPREYLQRNGKELTIRILFLYNPAEGDLH